MFKKLSVKKLILSILLVLLLSLGILAAFVYYKGKALEEAVTNYVNQFNAEQQIFSADIVESTPFFSSKNYTVDILANDTAALSPNKDAKKVVASFSFIINHGFGEVLSGQDAYIETLMTVNNVSTAIQSLPRFSNLLSMLNQLEHNEPIKLQGFFDLDINDALSGEFKTLNLSQLAKPIFTTDELSGSIDWDLSKKQAKLTLKQPHLSLSNETERQADEIHNDNSVAIVQIPKSNSLELNEFDLIVSFSQSLVPNNILLQANRLATADWNLERLSVELKPVFNNNGLIGLDAQLNSSKLTYDGKEYGSLKSNVIFGNLDYQLLESMVTKAQERYVIDAENNKRTYPLFVYYFAQWLNIERDFLSHAPFITINEFNLQNNANHLAFALNWSFTNDLNILSTSQPVITAIFNRTHRIDVNLDISQPMFREILSDILAKQSHGTDSELVDKYLFSLNEMNQTLPFLILSHSASDANKEQLSEVSLFDKDALLQLNFSYNTDNENVIWLGKEIKQFDVIAFIKKILE